MNSLNGLSNNSIICNLSGLSTGNFDYVNSDDVNSKTVETTTLYLNNNLFNPIDYITSTNLSSQLSNYITNSSLSTTLSSYVLTSALNTALNSYVSNTTLTNTLLNYVTTSSLTTQLNNYALASILTGCSYDSTLKAFQIGGTTDCRILNTLYLYDGSTPYNLNTYITNNSTNITSLVNKTTDISYSNSTTTIGNNLVINNIDGYSKTEFDNAINYSKSLTSPAQTQITDLKNSLIAVGIITTTSTGLVMTGYFLVIQGELLSLSTRITNCEDHDTTLLARTTKISYSDTTDTTTIAGAQLTVTNVIASDSLETNDIKSSGNINQIYVNNKNNTFRNPTYFQHNIELQNNKGFLIDAGSTFENNGLTNINNTLTVNATSNFYSNMKIRDNTTTNSGTILPYLNVCSTSTNVLARKLQGISIGVENQLNNQTQCNVGFNYVGDGNSGNYGYLGLYPNTLNIIESFRWFSGGCAVPVGDLTVASGGLTVTLGDIQVSSGAIKTKTINNISGYNLAMNATSTNNISLNSNLINIGYNQGLLAANVINIGATTSNSQININGQLNLNYGLGTINVGSVLRQWV